MHESFDIWMELINQLNNSLISARAGAIFVGTNSEMTKCIYIKKNRMKKYWNGNLQLKKTLLNKKKYWWEKMLKTFQNAHATFEIVLV